MVTVIFFFFFLFQLILFFLKLCIECIEHVLSSKGKKLQWILYLTLIILLLRTVQKFGRGRHTENYNI